MVVGHADIVGVLSGGLPPVVLFAGARSVGKWTTAEHLRRTHKILDSDLMRVRQLNAQAVRDVIAFSEVTPVGNMRLAIIRLDGARATALYALLKALEEPPAYMHYILVSSRPEGLPEPVLTRAQVHRFKYLTPEQVEQVLVLKKFNPAAAHTLSLTAGGQLYRVLDASTSNETKVPVLRVLKALTERDEGALEELSQRWTNEHTDLLKVWCEEAITTRWRVFKPNESDIQGVGFPLKVYLALQPVVRPRLVPRASLMNLIRER